MDRLVDHLTDDHDAFTRGTRYGSEDAEVLDDVQLHISLTAVPDQ
jgi:predicted small metal-binding protein